MPPTDADIHAALEALRAEADVIAKNSWVAVRLCTLFRELLTRALTRLTASASSPPAVTTIGDPP